jgi:acyl-CoA reductase-like NAD-dependent aldehyde dehydrogenase
MSFTGSTEVGREIQRAAAGNLKRLTLELGGKSANIVLDDADLDAALEGAMRATFRNQGEVCTAGARLDRRRVADELVERSHRASRRSGSAGDDPDTQMGPLVSQRQRDRVLELYGSVATRASRASSAAAATVDGARRLLRRADDLRRDDNDMRINREEIFGPAVAVIAVDDEDEAVRSRTTRATVSPRPSGRATARAPIDRAGAERRARSGSTCTAASTRTAPTAAAACPDTGTSRGRRRSASTRR